MTIYLEIAVNVPQVSDIFHYHLPPELENQVKVGCLVMVPFGRQVVQGVVVNFIEQPGVSVTRPVLNLVDPAAVLTPQQIALAQLLANETLSSLAACVGLMLPPGLHQQADHLYIADSKVPQGLNKMQLRLLTLLQRRGPLRGQQIDRAMGVLEWRTTARNLIQRGLIKTEPLLPRPRIRPKIVRWVRLACSPQVALEAMQTLGKAGSKALERRQIILNFLLREGKAVDVSWLYAASGGNLSDLRALSERGLVRLGESEMMRDPLAGTIYQPYDAPPLTRDQQAVWGEVRQRIHEALAGKEVPPILLHGVTGSGKTEIYLHAVQEVIHHGRQAIVLVPEIALTPQTIRRFVGRFQNRVGLIHSGLSAGERYDTWRRARAGELDLVVGPRSALFTPFEKLSLIVIDESHDDSYYQSEMEPHYHAREAAVAYARLIGGICLLGSATPDLVTFYRCQKGHWQYLRLPHRILAHRDEVRRQLSGIQNGGRPQFQSHYRPLEGQAEMIDLPPVSIIDMRQELQHGNRSIFSRPLQTALGEVLKESQQAILFLNRRGSATYVFCRDCGFTLKCPRCDLPLTYHETRAALLCHYCGYKRGVPLKCPSCNSQRIRHYGTGTQRVQSEVEALFPEARTLRWDYETTRKKGAHELILNHFVAHRADILIGTQMLAKGLDLPLVTLVGVILADVGLSLPDYRACERTFQVLTQVAGRAGRSPLGGQVILQTFQPDHYVIQSAARHDYQGFSKQELSYREKLGYPPFSSLVRLQYRHLNPAKAESAAKEMAERLREWLKEEGLHRTQLIGPAPCFFSRQRGLYYWHIILSGLDPASMLRGRHLDDWIVEVNPPSLL